MNTKPADALVRIHKIVGPNGIIPVGRSSFYQGIRDGIYPKPIRLGKRASAWRLSELLRSIERLSSVTDVATEAPAAHLAKEG